MVFKGPVLLFKNEDEEIHQILTELGDIVGLLFQRGDDLLDYNIRNAEGKALLGDLKSGYLNSFGAFLKNRLSTTQFQAFKNCKEMAGVYEIVGEKTFLQYVEAFDQINQEQIDLYFHLVEELKKLLPQVEASFFTNLNQLPKVLYWRNTKKS